MSEKEGIKAFDIAWTPFVLFQLLVPKVEKIPSLPQLLPKNTEHPHRDHDRNVEFLRSYSERPTQSRARAYHTEVLF